MNWHLARGSGPCTLLQWSKSKPSSALSPSRKQLSLMAKGRSWPISGYGASSRAVLAHSWKSSGSRPRISKCSRASLIQLRAVSSGPTLNVLHWERNVLLFISEQHSVLCNSNKVYLKFSQSLHEFKGIQKYHTVGCYTSSCALFVTLVTPVLYLPTAPPTSNHRHYMTSPAEVRSYVN